MGNTIKVRTNATGPEVYTKSEIDTLLNNVNSVSCSKASTCTVKPLQPSSGSVLVLGGSQVQTNGPNGFVSNGSVIVIGKKTIL